MNDEFYSQNYDEIIKMDNLNERQMDFLNHAVFEEKVSKMKRNKIKNIILFTLSAVIFTVILAVLG